ncbi:DUF1810 domain-containing protein [Sphingomonas sp. PL-96]|uniref:DUF1810 domain-containing protein n=1 Tax=Sphingomonas sp. PL-96 TaxID=2887201 RepID=UPI001E47DC02|nr:DUF1810 domain-containing protein [Sphingomonas sp. PL-96]MCC2977715.1 DUF1810 domain-containing protein [Sphingomonas sp. PL-96]
MAALDRFVEAQASVWRDALAELKAGRKTSHWMWFIFPQIAGLGRSETARFFAIADAEEARAFLAHPVLGERLRKAAAALLAHRGRSAEAVLGGIDAVKLRSSMTLFEAVAPEEPVFGAVLDAFFAGQRDLETLRRLG